METTSIKAARYHCLHVRQIIRHTHGKNGKFTSSRSAYQGDKVTGVRIPNRTPSV